MTKWDERICGTGAAAYTALLRADYAQRAQAGSGIDAHPTTAASAASGDLGFCTGPWVSSAADGMRLYGHYLSIWRRDDGCDWLSAFESKVSHGAPSQAEPPLSADDPAPVTGPAPPSNLIAAGAAAQSAADFQRTAIEDGFGGALRTFARNNDFEYLTDGESPMDLDRANVYLDRHGARGDWQESARGASGDATMLYTAGTLVDVKHRASRSYVQIWQFDPMVVNWGLRILLLGNPA